MEALSGLDPEAQDLDHEPHSFLEVGPGAPACHLKRTRLKAGAEVRKAAFGSERTCTQQVFCRSSKAFFAAFHSHLEREGRVGVGGARADGGREGRGRAGVLQEGDAAGRARARVPAPQPPHAGHQRRAQPTSAIHDRKVLMKAGENVCTELFLSNRLISVL